MTAADGARSLMLATENLSDERFTALINELKPISHKETIEALCLIQFIPQSNRKRFFELLIAELEKTDRKHLQ